MRFSSHIIIGFFFCSLAACLRANHLAEWPTDPTMDNSKAGADGPHVFYRGGKIVVKTIILEDTVAVARKQVYRYRPEVLLTCTVPETGDAFSFSLMDTIQPPADNYPQMPAKLLALSDIEGNFKAFKTMLTGAGIIDESFNWIFGKGHVVLLGDYFDRGTNVTECLWLAYKLEKEARAAGGQLHFILGNHEVMNLSGDFRYVRNKYFQNAELIGEDYASWYSTETELGRWLRSKNAMERIGTNLFCHGGVSLTMLDLKMSLTEINDLARKYYGVPEKDIKSQNGKILFNNNAGIFWYREMAKNKMNQEQVNITLNYFSVGRIIVGHTLQPDITQLYNNTVICIDLYHDDNIRQGFMKTLLLENNIPFQLDSKGNQYSMSVAARQSNENK